MEQAPWAGLPLPLPGPASASLPPIPKHNHCQGISFHRGETHPAPGAPATGQRAVATGCTPRGLSPGLSSTFRGKVRQSSQMQSEATTENSGRDQTQCRKTGFKYRGAPAGRPPNSQYLSHLPGPPPGPLHSSQLPPAAHPVLLGRAGEGERLLQPPGRGPALLSSKGADRT